VFFLKKTYEEMSGTNLEDVVEKLKSAIESIDNISVTTDTESALKDSGLVDAINSISVSLAAKLMPSALARMMERIEGALIAKQKLDDEVTIVTVNIAQRGHADISNLDRRMQRVLTDNYETCSTWCVSGTATCGACPLRVFATWEMLNKHVIEVKKKAELEKESERQAGDGRPLSVTDRPPEPSKKRHRASSLSDNESQ
jgi:hypothetical protein